MKRKTLCTGQPVSAAALPPAATANPGLQRCYSTGSLQQSVHSQTPAQVTPCATPPAVRFYSGVIRNGEAVPVATLRSATLPQPQGYPQAGMPVMLKHQSTASLRSHHSAASVPIGATPTSKDASPRRTSPREKSHFASRGSVARSVEEETCTSPRSVRSLQSPRSQRSQRSRSGSPKRAGDSSRARSRHNTGAGDMSVQEEGDGEEAPWEVPYAARTGSQSPRAATPHTRSDSQKRRYHDLYEDHEIRKLKWQAKTEEKKRREEAELQRGMANTCSPRHFNPAEFQNWPGTYRRQFYGSFRHVLTSLPLHLQGMLKA